MGSNSNFNTPLNEQGQPQYTGVQLHTSAQNIPITIFWGLRRVTPNVIWAAPPCPNGNPVGYHSSSNGGVLPIDTSHPTHDGSGFAFFGTLSVGFLSTGPYDSFNTPAWHIPAIFALGEGPIYAVRQLYDSQSHIVFNPPITSSATLFPADNVGSGHHWPAYLTFWNGSSTQALWDWWANFDPNGTWFGGPPTQHLNYRFTAYVAAWWSQGSSDQLHPDFPQQSFECWRMLDPTYYYSASGTGPPDANNQDYSLAGCIVDLLTSAQYGMGLQASDLDSTSLAAFNTYQFAQYIFCSPLLNGQDKAMSIIDRWAQIGNTWIYWDGTVVRFVPLADAQVNSSITGKTYTPDLTPAYNLTVDDFIGTQNPVTVNRADPRDTYNRLTIQVNDRVFNYSPAPIEWKDQGLIDQYGICDASSIQGDDICRLDVGQTVVNLMGRRMAYIRNTYSFKLSFKYIRILPGTIVTLTEPNLGLAAVPVRVRTVDEDDAGVLSVLAEELPGTTGISYPQGATPGAGTVLNQNVTVGSLNTPAIIEPSSALTGATPAVLVAASGGTFWGGADVWVSTDNISYAFIGTIKTPAPQGLLTATLASHADPDTADTLAVDTTESTVQIATTATHADADAARTLSVVAAQPTGTNPLVMPSAWELLSFGAVASTGNFTDNLTYLRRGQYGSTIGAHNIGDQFTQIDATGTVGSTIKWPLQGQYVNVPLYFKFLSFNIFSNQRQSLGDVIPYKYTPQGIGFGSGILGAPSTPTGLAAAGGAGLIFVSWNANPPTDNVTSYSLYAAPGLAQPFSAATLLWTGLSTTYTHAPLGNSVSYTYFLKANNYVGILPFSSPPTAGVSATTLASGAVGIVTGVDVKASAANPDNAHVYVGQISGFEGAGGAIQAHIVSFLFDTGCAVIGGADVSLRLVGGPPGANDYSGNIYLVTASASRAPGNVYANLGSATSSTQHPAFIVEETDNVFSVGKFTVGGVTSANIWLGVRLSTPDNTNYTLSTDASTGGDRLLLHNGADPSAPNGAAVLYAKNGELWVEQASTGSGVQNFHIQPGGGVSSVTGSGAGISVSPTTGAVVVQNTGVLSVSAGAGIGVVGTAQNPIINNTGVQGIFAGSGISINANTGFVTITATGGGGGSVTWAGDDAGSTNSAQYVVAIGSTGSSIHNGVLNLSIQQMLFDATQATPTIAQSAVAGTAHNLRVIPQQSTTTTSGSFEIDLSAPGGGGGESAIIVYRGASFSCGLGPLTNNAGAVSALLLYPGQSWSSQFLFTLSGDSSGNTNLAAPGVSGTLIASCAGVLAWQVAASAASMSLNAPLGGFGIPMPWQRTGPIDVTGQIAYTLTAAQYQCPIIQLTGAPQSGFVLVLPNNCAYYIVDCSAITGDPAMTARASGGLIAANLGQGSGSAFGGNIVYVNSASPPGCYNLGHI